jgi:hypothetical protein
MASTPMVIIRPSTMRIVSVMAQSYRDSGR